MTIDVHIRDDDYINVINQLMKELATARIQLESAKRTIRELDMSSPEGSRLLGIFTEEEGEPDEDELPGVSDAS